MFRLFRGFQRFLSKALNRARQSGRRATDLRSRGRGAAARTASARAAAAEELAEEIAELIQEAEDTIINAYIEAIVTMISMVGNSGQGTVMDTRVIPAFEEAFASSDPETGWEDVDIGEYMVFMGEIVEEGNSIMSEAYDEAASLLSEADSY